MATYKVPQDVEADDKLIGPFSFRQFIYLIIVALAIALAWGLSRLFIGLAIIPLPIILLFGALALPLRKDQPMEIYLAAIISYYLKPHRRLWDPDGVESLIEITVPKTVEVQRSKNISQADAEQRFSYLADIVDSGGWAIRGAGTQASQSVTINNDIFIEAQSAEDVLDGNNAVAQTFNTMMTKEAGRVRQEAIDRMHQAPTVVGPAPTTLTPVAGPPSAFSVPAPAQPPTPVYNPYPNIQQTVIQPLDDAAHQAAQPAPAPIKPPAPQTPPTTSDKPLSAGIMNLANNPDLSIETIAREAHRIQEKENDMSEEVVISLR
ncbi:MAG: PrgI family protein [Candidatus Microsaccharimonas sossegonensis]|uniref:PrgI family protein n=1 Tax=Candidatus Microsaccharimonas sossegonensis TaxID=2506948 RepID=A0A4Q0AGT7_9BACT|nr:MAG: PrgI family protein [Candidatus Microsaccharimonas sossegonensis]